MRPGLEERLRHETAALSDTSIPYSDRIQQLKQLIQAQERVVQAQSDGSIATPIDPDHTKDVTEYLARLKQIKVPR